MNRFTRGTGLFGAINVGGGSRVKGIRSGSVEVDPASIDSGAKVGIKATIDGVAVGDIVIVEPPAALEADLLFAGATVTDDDEVTISLYNVAGQAVNGAKLEWGYLHIKLT